MVTIVSPRQAWDALAADPEAQLVDVRTPGEWNAIGVPDLDEMGKKPALVVWQFPDGRVNRAFLEDLAAAGVRPASPVYFLCRSGVRSMAAAEFAEDSGFAACSNVAYGFEGDPDRMGRRGGVNGWQADGLGWRKP